jgi:hypothetical protein
MYIVALQEEERFVYDEMNTGHEDAAESKGPDQEDLDQRYSETLQEEEGDIRIASAWLERPREAKEEGGRAQSVDRYEE